MLHTSAKARRLTDDYGRSTHRFPSGRPCTDDGRLLWVPWVLGDKSGHEYFLDENKLGASTLAEALEAYNRLRVSEDPAFVPVVAKGSGMVERPGIGAVASQFPLNT